jgi:hypothetical protein
VQVEKRHAPHRPAPEFCVSNTASSALMPRLKFARVSLLAPAPSSSTRLAPGPAATVVWSSSPASSCSSS